MTRPAITAVRVWEKVNHTNMCRLTTAVKINECTPPLPSRLGVGEQAELGEIELALHPRLAIASTACTSGSRGRLLAETGRT